MKKGSPNSEPQVEEAISEGFKGIADKSLNFSFLEFRFVVPILELRALCLTIYGHAKDKLIQDEIVELYSILLNAPTLICFPWFPHISVILGVAFLSKLQLENARNKDSIIPSAPEVLRAHFCNGMVIAFTFLTAYPLLNTRDEHKNQLSLNGLALYFHPWEKTGRQKAEPLTNLYFVQVPIVSLPLNTMGPNKGIAFFFVSHSEI